MCHLIIEHENIPIVLTGNLPTDLVQNDMILYTTCHWNTMWMLADLDPIGDGVAKRRNIPWPLSVLNTDGQDWVDLCSATEMTSISVREPIPPKVNV